MTDPASHANRIGPYPIERELGRGGMGIVYLGRDTRLDRPVAIKVLPEAFAAAPDRLARFEREARLLASLQHPNIAAIHGLEESSGRRFLVLEYVEGETLAQRIAHGVLPVDDAIDVCRQIAAALEAAHEGGVIHRDLKPGNVKLTPAGDVKVLDFGLAKSGGGSGTSSDPSLSTSPTVALSAATGAGVILGTAAYMSPEQARGKSVDRRTDIWSFGCVLYECLTGRQVFSGETVSDMIALILQGEPDWKALPANTPPRLRELLARCLTKDPKKRLRDIGEARLVLEGGDLSQASAAFAGPLSAPAPARASRLAVTLAAIFALSTAALAALMLLRAPEPAPVRRLTLEVPPTPASALEPANVALSPDGTTLVAWAADTSSDVRLWLRSLDALDGRTLAGTEDGTLPFWSPDGRYLVFATQDKLKKLDVRGGSPEVLCPVASYGRGGSWGSRDVIVFAAGSEGPLFRVSKDGGTPEPTSALDSTETGHRFPRFLPDGRHFLYSAMPPRGTQFTIWIGSIDDPKQRERLMVADGTPVYVEPGWLLCIRNERVVAHRFDARSRKLIGEPVALPDVPSRTGYMGSPSVVASLRGPLAYFREQPAQTRLVWTTPGSRDRQPLPLAPGPYGLVSLSHDGRRALVARRTSQVESDFWMIDLQRMVQTRFTPGPGRVDRPAWSPDGTRVAYSTDRSGRWDIYVKAIDGTGAGEAVLEAGSLLKFPSGWTPDGQTLVFEQLGEKTGWDIWLLPLHGDRTPRPLFVSAADEQYGAVSPNGRWIAYASNESGRSEIYVESFPEPGRRHQITTAGGVFASWRADGRALFVGTNDGSGFFGVDPETGRPLGDSRRFPWQDGIVGGDVQRDFERFLFVVTASDAPPSDDMTVVENWRSELGRR